MNYFNLTRRNFISTASIAGTGLAIGLPTIACGTNGALQKPAILGGPKAFTGSWHGWPVIENIEETELLAVLKSGNWCRLGSKTTPRFETELQNMLGVNRILGTSSGTTALFTMLGALDIGPGDEIILPPYTFIATYNVIVQNYALPVFVDSDIETFQIDATKIEQAITPETKVLLPVHIGGNLFDIDTVLNVASKYNIPVIEDACQAHFAEWKGKSAGGWGLAGAYSFQASKNLNSGEGGAIITNNEDFYKRCYSFHHQGQSDDSAGLEPGTGIRGSNLRLTEFQAAILLAQMSKVQEQVKRRSENADYLTKMLSRIPGISPAKHYKGYTRSAYHLYMFRYNPNEFSGMSRAQFIKALGAEGIPASSGYTSMTKNSYVTNLAKSKHYLQVYGEKKMNDWLEQISTPVNDKLCEEAVWFTQNMLLGGKQDMEQIAEAIRKIHHNSKAIKEV